MRLGLRAQALLATATASLVVVAATSLTAAWVFAERQLAAERSRAQAIGQALAIGLERILALDIPLADLQGFDEQCDEAMTRHDGLSFALVVDASGQLLFRSGRSSSPAPALPPLALAASAAAEAGTALQTPDGTSDLVPSAVRASDGTVVGQVVVGLPRAALQAERNRLLLMMAGAAAAALLLVLLLLRGAMQRVLVSPLGRVVQAVERMRAGDRQAAALQGLEQREDELGVLADGFGRLVHEVAQREHELVAARDEAQQASRAKSQFLAMMSHELRTPLNAVVGMSDLLARTPLDARQQRLVGQVRASGRQLAAIIADLLDLSGIEAGRLQVAQLPYRLRDTLDEVVERFADDAQQRRLALTIAHDPALPERLVGDALRVQQVLSNLLSNALKFTERGGVSVSVTPATDAVRVTVVDSGIGIDPEFLPHLYEAFRQADGSISRRFGGSGLGLSIARALCDAMGGRIDVASRPGRGTTFWFELPLRMPPDEDASAPPVPAAALSAPDVPAPARPPVDVLLVEDDPGSRELVAQVLHGSPYRLTMARDGTEGLRLLRERRWGVVLLDWRLPGIDGRSLLTLLRATDGGVGGPRTPVLVITADAFEDQRLACLGAGADEVMAKPVDMDALLAALVRLSGAGASTSGHRGAVAGGVGP
ncbi:MAG: ATP-binding protein [Rubrivivax sp.]